MTTTTEDSGMEIAAHAVTVPVDVAIVCIGDEVLLIVAGSHTAENRELVAEVHAAVLRSGTPADRVDVLWS